MPIGEMLRRERLKRNLNLDQVSQELKISARFLQAIEDERFEKLPAGVFARSFLRQYASLLGLDADELTAELQRTLPSETSGENPPGAPAEPRGFTPDIRVPRVEEWEAVGDRRNWSSSLPAFALVIVVMLVCSGIYAFWQRPRHVVTVRETPPAAQKQEPPVAVVPAAQPPAPAAAQPENAPADRAVPGNTPEHAAAAAGSSIAPPEANRAPAAPNPGLAAATPAAPANPPANPNGAVHVELTAAEPVWVLARVNGKYLFSTTLEANQTRSVDANGVLFLRLGNAGGVNITLNGKAIGPVGPKGQVREVQFTSGGFQIVAASKPALPDADRL